MYVAELRTLAEYCNFGETLEKMLHDCLVTGINNDGIQKKLQAESKLMYKQTLEIVQGCEESEKNLREMRADCDTSASKQEVRLRQQYTLFAWKNRTQNNRL